MSETERKARLREIDRQTAETLASPFYRKHPSLRKQTLDYLKQRRDELKPKTNPRDYTPNATCNTCGRKANDPFRRYDASGKIIYGCIDDVHTGHLVPSSNSSAWYNRPEAKKHRAAVKKHMGSLGRKRNGMFDRDAVSRARQVTRTPKRVESPKARRTIVEKTTGEKGYLVSTLPGGWLKVKWDNREKPTLIKRSELKRARNPKGVHKTIKSYDGWHVSAKLPPDKKFSKFWYADLSDAKKFAESVLADGGEATIAAAKIKANPGILDLVGGMQALDYLSGKFKGARKRNPKTKAAPLTLIERKLYEQLERAQKARFTELRNTEGRGASIKYAARIIKSKRKPNPSPAEMSERFQGHATGSVKNYYASDSAPRLDYSRAGRLVFLKIGGKQVRIPGAVAAIDPRTEKIWIAGSKRGAMFTRKAARKGEALDFGEVESICYLTAKSHIGSGKRYEYVHAFGEEGGRRPRLLIDYEGMPILKGGDYRIKAEGIVN